MLGYILGRLAAAIPVLLVISVLAFMLQALSPGDPARLLIEASGLSPAPAEMVAEKRAELRLDDPVLVRYTNWLWNAIQGDLGRSYRSYQPVTKLYLERLPATLALAGAAGAVSASIAIPLGLLAAYKRGRPLDGLAQVVAVTGAAIPGFWIALVLMYVFGARLNWLPVFGSLTPTGIIMPAIVVALPNIAVLTRLTRTATLDVLGQDYVTVARMKGLTNSAVARGHVLPNVTGPVLTVFGLELAGLLTGAAVVEYVFAWPGIGKLAVDAVLLRDTPVVVGFAVAAGLIFVIMNLMVDVLVTALDPRIRGV
jgi:ABC-type dipeptide/oligopeptide/nickel transport system permease component